LSRTKLAKGDGWTLFLDRDGVINTRLIDDYVKTVEEFEFIKGSVEAIAQFDQWFDTIVVVTNQQGIGKGLMTEEDLSDIHALMMEGIEQAGGRVDAIYHCPMLRNENPNCRKPNPAMGHQAKADFPDIDFGKSVMIGDSVSDMEFGEALGMLNIFITPEPVKFDRNLTQWQTISLVTAASILQEKMT
jgi:histidinol-phosphate phosphatase family protein